MDVLPPPPPLLSPSLLPSLTFHRDCGCGRDQVQMFVGAQRVRTFCPSPPPPPTLSHLPQRLWLRARPGPEVCWNPVGSGRSAPSPPSPSPSLLPSLTFHRDCGCGRDQVQRFVGTQWVQDVLPPPPPPLTFHRDCGCGRD